MSLAARWMVLETVILDEVTQTNIPRGDVTAEEAAGASPAKVNGQVGALGTARPGPLLSYLAPSRAPVRGRALCPARDTRRPLPRPVPLFSAPQPPRAKRGEGRGGGAGL